MDLATFNTIVDETIDKCVSVLAQKGIEYTRGGNRLSNFKQAGMLDGDTSIKALGGMMKKHTVSLYDYIKDLENGVKHSLDEWDEKIVDHINYLILLRALLIEGMEPMTECVEPDNTDNTNPNEQEGV